MFFLVRTKSDAFNFFLQYFFYLLSLSPLFQKTGKDEEVSKEREKERDERKEEWEKRIFLSFFHPIHTSW